MFAALAHQLHILGIDKAPREAATVRHELVEFMQSDTQFAANVAQGLSEGIIYFCFKLQLTYVTYQCVFNTVHKHIFRRTRYQGAI